LVILKVESFTRSQRRDVVFGDRFSGSNSFGISERSNAIFRFTRPARYLKAIFGCGQDFPVLADICLCRIFTPVPDCFPRSVLCNVCTASRVHPLDVLPRLGRAFPPAGFKPRIEVINRVADCPSTKV
jgi:hypothetical protein